jgi:transcriptional regulator of aromatic amino acid metabolism
MRTTLLFPILNPAHLMSVALALVVFSCGEKGSSNPCDTTKVFLKVDNLTVSQNSIEKKEIDALKSQLDDLSTCKALKKIDLAQIEDYHKSLNMLIAKVNKFQVNVDSTDANIEKHNFVVAASFLDTAKSCFPKAQRIVSLTDKLNDAQMRLQEEKRSAQSNPKSPSKKGQKDSKRTIKNWTPTAEF